MKTLAILLVASNVFASCPDGWVEWPKNSHQCAAIPNPEDKAAPEVQPSKEKPPRHPEPAWQRGEVNAAMPESLAARDAKEDHERAEADAQGKKAAGISTQ